MAKKSFGGRACHERKKTTTITCTASTCRKQEQINDTEGDRPDYMILSSLRFKS